jgi:hypothetical protein
MKHQVADSEISVTPLNRTVKELIAAGAQMADDHFHGTLIAMPCPFLRHHV